MSSRPRSLSSFVDRICEEPYRLFFPLGILIGIVGVGHWFLFARGWSMSYSGFYHSSIQTQGYLAAVVFGFLMTMIPRQSGAPRATRTEIITHFLLLTGIVTFHSLGMWMAGELFFAGLLVHFTFFLIKRFKKRTAKAGPPVEFVWIPIALFHGIAGTVLLMLAQQGMLMPGFLMTGKAMVEQGFILSIVLGVGSFLGTRLMGLQHIIKPVDAAGEKKFFERRTRAARVNMLGGLFLLISFAMEAYPETIRGAYALRSAVAMIVLGYNGAWPRFPRAREFFAWLIWVSMWMVVLGYLLSTVFWTYRKDMLHIVFIGGYSLMIFAVGTMVVLSHAGQGHLLHKRLWVLWMVAVGIAGALGHRLSASYLPETYHRLIGSAAAFWLSAAAGWLGYVLNKIIWAGGKEDAGSCQEETERKIRDD